MAQQQAQQQAQKQVMTIMAGIMIHLSNRMTKAVIMGVYSQKFLLSWSASHSSLSSVHWDQAPNTTTEPCSDTISKIVDFIHWNLYPDKHGKVDNGHCSTGEAVDGHANLLSAVNLAILLSTLLVDLGPAVDTWWHQSDNMKTTI